MLPLLLLALALSAGLATYEFSPRVHAWVDDHAQALRAAGAAHRAADAHLDAVSASSDQGTAANHVHEAIKANQAAAGATIVATKTAKAPSQRAAAADSALKVVKREEKIATTLMDIGVGQCDVRSYAGVTPVIKDVLIAKLNAKGMAVTGDNPWDVDTHKHGVKLRALWDPASQMLKLIVTAGKGNAVDPFGIITVTCNDIWSEIEPVLKEIIGS